MFPALFLLLLSFVPGPRLNFLEYLVFPEGEGFKIITKDSVFYTLDGMEFSSRKHYYSSDVYRLKLVPSSDSHKFFIADGGGVVFKFENDTLFRVDQSYRWRSRYNSLTAATGDTIYLYGGYGEFTFYNDLLRFDQSTREWVEIPVQEPRPPRMSNALGQIDLDDRALYIGFGSDSRYVEKRSTYRPFYEIGKFDMNSEHYEVVGNMEFIRQYQNEQGAIYWKSFHHYKTPIFYSNRHLFDFDFINGKAHLHYDADYSTLEQFSDILAYNPSSNKFLLGGTLLDNPRYRVIDELDLLGRRYTIYDMERLNKGRNGFLWAGALLFIILLYLFTGKNQQFIELINQNRNRIRPQLSDEDFNVLQIIIDAYPNFVDYPELQNSFERDLSYESRIKKLRTTVKTLDDTIKTTLKLKSSVFEIEKGKEDKRVKVIRLKDQSLRFSKLRSLLPF